MLKGKNTDPRNQRYFDEKTIPDDVWLVLQATSLLGVGEFRVFEIAYKEWFGEAGEEKTVERYFTPYMFNNVVPSWVRHFASRIVKLDQEGRLNAGDFGIHPQYATRESVRKGIDFAAWLVLSLTGIVLLGKIAAGLTGLSCILPPCY